jgi:hypothetical protein
MAAAQVMQQQVKDIFHYQLEISGASVNAIFINDH